MTTYEPRVQVPADSRVGLRFGTGIDHGVAAFAQSVLAGHRFEPALVEAVRLLCARTHDCRACMSLRSTDVLGATEVDERTAVALRFTDAVLASPVVLDASLRADLARHFTPEEVTGLGFLIMKWAHQKVHVALRIEPPISSEGLTEVTFTADGRTVLGERLTGQPD